LVKDARYYWLKLAESHPTRRLFASMLLRIGALAVATWDGGLVYTEWDLEVQNGDSGLWRPTRTAGGLAPKAALPNNLEIAARCS
jgi:hypothetical protein